MRNQSSPFSQARTSWESSEKWYKGIVGDEGHYYHRQIIMPGVLRLLEKPKDLLDLGCGNGILAKHLPSQIEYVGIDAAPSLIKAAKTSSSSSLHHFEIGDITKPIKLEKRDFSHATLILSLQNIEEPYAAFVNAAKHLRKQGKLILVLNHPCFRIPRQSSWQVDEAKKVQYRRIDCYMHPMKVPIQTHPGKGIKSQVTYSFHHPLSSYFQWLHKAGFAVELLEEWCSDKTSQGKAAKMENRSRAEFPLFMGIRAVLLEELNKIKV